MVVRAMLVAGRKYDIVYEVPSGYRCLNAVLVFRSTLGDAFVFANGYGGEDIVIAKGKLCTFVEVPDVTVCFAGRRTERFV